MTVDRAFWYNVAIMRKRDETGLSGWGRGVAGLALGLVAAFVAPGARAWTASNAFVVVEAATPVSNAGEGFSVPSPGRVRIEPRRDWVLAAPRPRRRNLRASTAS